MALETGARVGIYEVTGKLGEGGMGEVYRAHDTTLDRDGALKVLSEAFTADEERLWISLNGELITTATSIKNLRGHIGIQGELGLLEFRKISVEPL